MLRLLFCSGVWWLLAAACASAAAPVHQSLEVALDASRASLQVRGEMSFPPGAAVEVRLDGRYAFDELRVDGVPITPDRIGTGEAGVWRWSVPASAQRPRLLRFAYRGGLTRLDDGMDHRQVLALRGAVAGREGSFLPAGSGWHPQAGDTPFSYRVALSVPSGERAVAPGALISEQVRADGHTAVFEQVEPLAGIDVFAGPYTVAERRIELAPGRAVLLRTYFHAELADLAAGYLDSAARYLARYDRLIGDYPFAAYSIVSSPLPTGFGMPGIAYLGRQVIRLPFIRATSLGHEVLHNWWGNGVVPDYARGNWSEGLTTFMADYAYREDEGEDAAREMRLAWLRDFAAVRPELDQPLARFVSRRHGAGQAVGYNKAAFVFHMLRDLVGQGAFEAGLRDVWVRHRLQTAGWAQLRTAFERAAGRDLGPFFAQWIDRSGAPSLAIASALRTSGSGRERIVVSVAQSGTPFLLRVPLRVHLEDGRVVDATVDVAGKESSVSMDVPARATAVSLDPDVRLFRRLAADEVAPILRQVLIDPRTGTLVAGADAASRAAATALAEASLDHGVRLRRDARPTQGGPFLIVGTHGEVDAALAAAGLPPVPAELRGRGSGYAYAWQERDGPVYAVASGQDAQALAAMARSLPHLGAQSHAVFEGARSVARGVWRREAVRHAVREGAGP